MIPKLEDFAPDSILDDEIRALCAALDEQLSKLDAESNCVLHLPRLDELSGKILDILADQFHVDFYDSLNFDEETKRNAIRDSIKWHRLKGTPYAVEKVCADFNQRCDLSEWFEYGDPPAWFRICTDPFYGNDIAGWLRAILIAKNVRSWCRLRFEHSERTALYVGIADFVAGNISVSYAPPITATEVKICAGIATFIGGRISVGIAVDNHAETLPICAGIATFIGGRISVGIANDATVIPYYGIATFIGGRISVGKAGD